MYGHIAFFIWILNIILGGFDVFLLIMIRRGKPKKISQLKYLLLFVCCILSACFVYIIFSYRQIGFDLYNCPWILRLSDCASGSLIILTWVLIVSNIINEMPSFLLTKINLLGCLIIESVISVFFMTGDYSIDNIYVMNLYRYLVIYEELLYLTVMCLAIYSLNKLKQKIIGYRTYITISCMLALLKIDEAIVEWNILHKHYDIFNFGPQPFNIQFFIILAVLCLITVYIFRLYIKVTNTGNEDLTRILDYIMIEYKLTHREREVIELMYRRMSNEEMAAKLFVSINTIKTHVKNIYSKMEINNRTQFISMIECKK